MNFKYTYLAVLLLIFTGCLKNKDQASCPSEKLYEDYHQWQLESFPMYASSKNWGERHNEFFENTEDSHKKIWNETKDFLARTQSLLKDKACKEEEMNLSLLKTELSESVEEYKYKDRYVQFQSMGGPHTWLPQMSNRVPLKTLQNYKDYLERMSQIPKVFEQAKVMSMKGVEEGITPPQVTFEGYESSFLDQASGSAKKNPFYKPFLDLPEDFTKAEKEQLRTQAQKIIKEEIQPAYVDLHKFWVNDYYPKLRETIAASDLPNGEEFYEFRIKKMTTLDMTAKEVHEIGMNEVKRILSEMKSIKNKMSFEGSLDEFFKELRTNPKYYAKSKEELLEKASFILKTADGRLPKLFKKLPMLSYGIEPIPDYIADKSPAAYYMHGDMELGKSGTYQINLSNLDSRPLYNLVALSLHEAVPGHHLQIALAQELKGLPEFRKDSGPTAFIEGWGLYAESLGKLMGMYKDPLDDFGRLTYEQWRAMRLVVDTGIHALGWSREKAIQFMKDNSGLSEKNITTEVDRYINWPGQALAYKLGELKFKELRALAKKELGDQYDIREYHEVVLGSGAIPLPLLEKKVRDYIRSKEKNNKKT